MNLIKNSVMLEDNDNSDIYFTDDCLIEDEYYNGIKDLIKCKFCHKILKDPMMCNDCQVKVVPKN